MHYNDNETRKDEKNLKPEEKADLNRLLLIKNIQLR
jgi:hypothetical protein